MLYCGDDWKCEGGRSLGIFEGFASRERREQKMRKKKRIDVWERETDFVVVCWRFKKKNIGQLGAQLFLLEGAFSGAFVVVSLIVYTHYYVFFTFSLVIFNFLSIVQLFGVWMWCCNTLLSYICFFISKYDYSLYNSLISLFLLPYHLYLVFYLLLGWVMLVLLKGV